ncbi:MAG: SusC/RagA family TonB-linked outer membrane protein [Gemmatimonadaceae bacterium]
MRPSFRRVLAVAGVLTVLPAWAGAQGTITGRVTDRSSQQPVPNAQVLIVGTTRGSLTDEQGQYRIANVAAGNVQVRALRIGYEAATQVVAVPASGNVTADFTLAASAVQIDRVVVTATGETQRRRESGVSTAVINADSLNLAPIQNFSNVLASRAAGVTVQQAGGTSGTGSRIRIRGANSVSLSNEPLLIVDGIRVVQNAGALVGNPALSIAVGGQQPSRFDDINPEDIENIEIIKGPAAAALYGTAAANGVIQVTTKRGRAGRARWTAFAEGGTLTDVGDYPANFAQVGTLTNQTNPANNGLRTTNCNIDNRAQRLCVPVADSLYSHNPLVKYSPFREGWRQTYGLSVAGGSEVATYYVSSDFEREQGVLQSNAVKKFNLRGNVRGQLRDNLDVTLTTGFLSSRVALPFNDNSTLGTLGNGYLGSAFDGPNKGFLLQPSDSLQAVDTRQQIDRFSAGLNGNWQPLSWLSAVGTFGVDLVNQYDHRTVPAGFVRFGNFIQGQRTSNRFQTFNYTANGGATASFALTPELQSSTSAGVQYDEQSLTSTEAFGLGLLTGTGNLQGTTSQFAVDEDFFDIITVGAYVQQQFAWRDRLFVTGSVRGDDNSAFGQDFGLIYYPSVSLSWVIGEEPFFPQSQWLSTLRLRTAYGESGQRPGFRQADNFFAPTTVRLNAADVPAITVGGTGNAELTAEKSGEFEVGFDAGLFGDRVNLEVTYYDRTTRDALIATPLAFSVGGSPTRFDNIGEVKNSGLNALVNATVLNRENARWDVTVSAATNKNELIDLGAGIEPIVFGLGGDTQRHQNGYPLGGFWQQPILSFTDLNGDGIISRVNCPAYGNIQASRVVPGGPACEIVLGDTGVYMGAIAPSTELSFTSSVTLFRWLRVAGLLDYKGGFKQFNSTREFRCGTFFNCQEVQDPTAGTLEEQAAAIAAMMGTAAGYIEDASYWKLRELSVTLTAPERWVSRVGVSGLSLTLAGRNLKTWTDYTGQDPELNLNAQLNFNQAEFFTQPPVRTYTARVNINW